MLAYQGMLGQEVSRHTLYPVIHQLGEMRVRETPNTKNSLNMSDGVIVKLSCDVILLESDLFSRVQS